MSESVTGTSTSKLSSLHESLNSGSGGPQLQPGREGDDLLEDRAVGTAIFGVMYTVCKEKNRYSWVFIGLRLLADWLQLWLIVVNPSWFAIQGDALWWRIVSFVQLNDFMSARGYTFFLACFYLLLVGLIVSVAISIWVGRSFTENRFNYVWPIVFLRWFANIFYQMLDIMSLTLFLMALDCQYFSRPAEQLFYNQEFPDVYCWSMPHVVHAFVGAIAVCAFTVLACAFSMGEMELNFTTKNVLAIMHTGAELEAFILRFLMACVSVFVVSLKWMSVAELVLACRLVWVMLWWQPQVYGWVNHVRVGMYTSVAWCSVLFVLRAFELGANPDDLDSLNSQRTALTNAMWATFVPMGLLGAWVSHLRLKFFTGKSLQRFKSAAPTDLPHEIFEFSDSRQAEILARCCRVWVKKDVLDPDSVHLAEAVLKCALAQLPKDPYAIVLHSSFLIDVQGSYQSGYTALQAAKKMDPSFLMRYAIFTREQQHTQKSADGAGGKSSSRAAATDLVSYVEFQRNYSLAVKVHREALLAMRGFWEVLMHSEVQFRTLARCIKTMDQSIRAADRVYKQVLSRHASHVKIVRLYAKFLEHVKHDPWSAAKWFAEAEKLEIAEEEGRNNDVWAGMEADDPELQAALIRAGAASGQSTETHCIIIVNSLGIIQMTNKVAHTLFGYNKTELRGKNISMLLPAVVAESHTSYIRNFITTGRTNIMGRTTEQVAVHKERYLVPLSLNVSKLSGVGEDTLFIGIMEQVMPEPDTATVWIMRDGSILSAGPVFTDWFAYASKEVEGKPFSSLVATGNHLLEKAIAAAKTAAALDDQSSQVRDNIMMHAKSGATSSLVGSAIMRVSGSCAAGGMQPVAEATEEDPELGLLAGMEEEEGGVAPVPAPGRRRRHRSRKNRSTVEEEQPVPEAERVEGPYLAPEDTMDAAAGENSFKQPPADIETGSGPRPPSVAKADASRASSGRIQPAAYSVSGRASFSMPQPPASYRAAGHASFSALPPAPASPSLHNSPSPFGATAVQSVAESGPAPALKKASWVVKGVSLTHKYTDPTDVDITITNAGAGVLRLQKLTLRLAQPSADQCMAGIPCMAPSLSIKSMGQVVSLPRIPQARSRRPSAMAMQMGLVPGPSPVPYPISQELMLVASGEGAVVHVTNKLATLLGRTVQQVLANGSQHTLEQLMVEPFSQMHRTLAASIPQTAPPAHSCRSGLSFLMSELGAQGRAKAAPFRMSLKRQMHGDDALHVMCFEKRSLEQALDERRLIVEVNTQGVVQAILSTSTPGSLFGFEPHRLMGKSLGEVVDVLHLEGKGASITEEDALLAGTQDSLLAQVLLELAAQSMEHAGISWRVGVSPPMDEAAGQRPGLPRLSRSTRPAIMRMQVLDMGEEEQPDIDSLHDNPHNEQSSGIVMLVELWRSDLVTSVLEVDNEGNVMNTAEQQAALGQLYPPGLLLGVGSEVMLEYHISAFFPQLGERPVSDLFTADTFGPAPAQAGTRRLADPSKRSNMKRANQSGRGVARAGPQQVLKLHHSADEMPLEVVVQAVRKNGSGYYLVLHPLHPAAGRPDFVPWMLGKQQMSLEDAPPPVTQMHSTLGNPAQKGPTGHPARHIMNAMSLRQRSRDLGAAPGTPGKSRPPHHAVLSALANLGLPTPAVTGGKPGAGGARQGAAPERAASDQESGSCSSGSEEDEEASGDSLADSAKHPRLQMSRHLSGLVSPKVANGVQDKAQGTAYPQAVGHTTKGTQNVGRVAEWVATSPPLKQHPSAADAGGQQPYGSPGPRRSSGGASTDDDEAGSQASGTSHDGGQQDTALDSDKEADAAQLDEATGDGISDQDFTRGKRFRKLHRVLVSTVIQRPIDRLRKTATAIAAGLALVHLGMFIMIYTMLNQQMQLVNDLGLMGKAGILATEIALTVRNIRFCYTGNVGDDLRHISSVDDIPYNQQLLKQQIADFLLLHTGAYMGYTSHRRMPDAYGLRSLWEDQLLPGFTVVQVPANETFGNFTVVSTILTPTNYSLYSAGNLLAKYADTVHEQVDEYNLTYPRNPDGSVNGDEWAKWPPLFWIANNVPNGVINPYLTSLNSYLELVLASAVQVNNLQLMLLAIEGVGLCVIAMFWMWMLLQRVAAQRYSMLCVFMIIPGPLVRRLALRKLQLTDEEDEDDDNDNLTYAAAKGTVKQNKAGVKAAEGEGEGAQEGAGGNRDLATMPGAIKFSKHGSIQAAAPAAQQASKDIEAGNVGNEDAAGSSKRHPRGTPGFLTRLLLCCGLGRGNWNVGTNKELTSARKRLAPSYATTLWLIWPFLAWGCLIVVCYAVGYTLLGLVSEPICLFNIVNWMASNVKYNIWLTQKIVASNDLAAVVSSRNFLYARNQGLKVDYRVMLYGMQAIGNETATTPQFSYIHQGLAYSGSMGEDIMFNYRGCFCANSSECWSENSTMFALTNNGLDRMVEHFFQFADSLPTFRGTDPDMGGSEFYSVWGMIPDMTDGFAQLATAYQGFVQLNMNSVLGLHTAVFVLSLALMGCFVFLLLRPFLTETANETRRIAELLSQLPAEMDVDTMLAKTLLADMGLMGAAQQMAGKGGLTADGLKQVAAASSGKVQPAVPMTKTRSMQ